MLRTLDLATTHDDRNEVAKHYLSANFTDHSDSRLYIRVSEDVYHANGDERHVSARVKLPKRQARELRAWLNSLDLED